MERIVTDKELANEIESQKSLRPKRFSEYIGQTNLKEKMGIFIEAAKEEEGALTTLFYTDLQDWEKLPLPE